MSDKEIIMMYKNISRLSLLCFTLAQSPSYACDAHLQDREISVHHLTQAQHDELKGKIAQNVKLNLDRTFTGGETMINLMDVSGLGVKLVQKPSGEFETRYTVRDGWTCTMKQTEWGITALMDKPHKPQVRRLDGKLAKQNPDGSYSLGIFRPADGQPIPGTPLMLHEGPLPFRKEVQLKLNSMEKERRPEELRDQKFSHHTQVKKKPDPEEVRLIQEKQSQSREERVNDLTSQFSALRVDVLTTPEQAKKISSFNLTIKMAKNNINNAQNFDVLLGNAQTKYTELNKEINEILRQILINKPSLSTPFQPSLISENQEMREIKERTDRQIKDKEVKEKSHLERPNANPLGGVVEAQAENHSDEEKGNTGLYTFSSIPLHGIIDALQGTSDEDSSYVGISISREQLQNFIEFLEQAEKDERTLNGLADPTDLGYSYDPSGGKGSHLKVKFGRGTKPVILSDQGRLLIVAQMRDVKDALIQKGLIK